MTTDFSTRHAYEAKTYEIFATLGDDASTAERIIAIVFKAMWHASLTAEKVALVGDVMTDFSGVNYQTALTKLVRCGVLRSRTQGGRRLYEVNY